VVAGEVTLDTGLVNGAVASVVVAWELLDLESAVVVVEVFKVKLDVLAEGELAPRPISDKAVAIPEAWDGPGFDMGWVMLVERYMISFP